MTCARIIQNNQAFCFLLKVNVMYIYIQFHIVVENTVNFDDLVYFVCVVQLTQLTSIAELQLAGNELFCAQHECI